MKMLVLALIVLASGAAHAEESYKCAGKVDRTNVATMDLTITSLDQITVLSPDGSDYTLKVDTTNARYRVYADYEYDGYGGSVVVRLPKNLSISGSDAMEEFNLQFSRDVYSELGKVSSTRFSGRCQRIDN